VVARMRLRSSGIGMGFSTLTFAPPVLPSGTHIRESSAAATMLAAWRGLRHYFLVRAFFAAPRERAPDFV